MTRASAGKRAASSRGRAVSRPPDDVPLPTDDPRPSTFGPPGRLAALRRAFDLIGEDSFEAAAALSRLYAGPDDIEHSLLLALALGLAGEVDEPGELFARVAAARDSNACPVEDLIRMLRDRGREDEGLAHAERAAALRPDDHRALGCYAIQLIAMLRPAEAEPLLHRALTLSPMQFAHVNQLGIALTDQGFGAGAEVQFRLGAALEPGNHVAWTNLGCVLSNTGAFDEALTHYRRAIMLQPENPAVRVNHAICLLKAGRMAQGWAEYEWRLRTPNHTDLPLERLLPSLDNQTRLDGRTVLVTHEEGLGDTIQFMRYLAPLRATGARVIAWVPTPLARLVAAIDGIEVVTGGIDQLEFTWHCPFISLPRAFSATASHLPAAPYLRTDPTVAARLRAHLPQGEALTVGLVWGGAPRREHRQAYSVDLRRSMGGRPLLRLRSVPNARFVSLQLGPHRDDLALLGDALDLVDPMAAPRDLHDTAALIEGLDVVVSVDTSVVHLAAGLGKPTILLDRHDNCWRWLHGRDDSPSYPTLRLIRQRWPGDWSGVVERLELALTMLSDAKRAGGGGPLPIASLHRAMNEIGRFGTCVPA